MQSTPSQRIYLIVMSILLYHVCPDLPRGLSRSDFPTKIRYASHVSTTRATCPANLVHLDWVTRMFDKNDSSESPQGRFTHSMPFPCRADKGLECVFPIWFTQCGLVWFTLAMPCPCHALTMPFFSRPQHSTAVFRRPCCTVALRRTAWSEHDMASVNQTRPHCVNQMGKTHSKPLAARHGNGMLCLNRPSMCTFLQAGDNSSLLDPTMIKMQRTLKYVNKKRRQFNLLHCLTVRIKATLSFETSGRTRPTTQRHTTCTAALSVCLSHSYTTCLPVFRQNNQTHRTI